MPMSTDRPYLSLSREEARKRIWKQIVKGKELPNVSINDSNEARRWYEYTAELLRRICTTDELTDEFTGRSSFSFGDVDIRVGRYLEKLNSIYERIALYPEEGSNVVSTNSANPLMTIEYLISRFHVVARQLRYRYNNRPTLDVNDEYDVQNLFHALLRLYFDDIRPEEWTPSYAGGSSRMDFLLKAERIVVEVKKTRHGLGAKEIGEQLSLDIIKYRSHPNCKVLICFVYDPEERVFNPMGIEGDLSKPVGELDVRVYIAQS